MKRKKRKIKRINFINILFVLSTLLLIFLMFKFINQKIEISNLKNDYNKLTEERKELSKSISDLKYEITKINDLDYIEKLAREKLGMIKKDEKIYTNSSSNETETKDETIQESLN